MPPSHCAASPQNFGLASQTNKTLRKTKARRSQVNPSDPVVAPSRFRSNLPRRSRHSSGAVPPALPVTSKCASLDPRLHFDANCPPRAIPNGARTSGQNPSVPVIAPLAEARFCSGLPASTLLSHAHVPVSQPPQTLAVPRPPPASGRTGLPAILLSANPLNYHRPVRSRTGNPSPVAVAQGFEPRAIAGFCAVRSHNGAVPGPFRFLSRPFSMPCR